MKKTLQYLIVVLALCLSVSAVNAQSVVNFYVVQFNGTTNDTVITLRAQNNPIIYKGAFYWWPANGTNLTTTNGFASATLIPSHYIVSLAGVPQSWNITVTNSATALNAIGLTTSTIIYNGINSLSGPAVSTDGHGNYFVSAAGTNGITSVTNLDGTITIINSPGIFNLRVNTNVMAAVDSVAALDFSNPNNSFNGVYAGFSDGTTADPALYVTNAGNDYQLDVGYYKNFSGGSSIRPDGFYQIGPGTYLWDFTNGIILTGNKNGFFQVDSNGNVEIGGAFSGTYGGLPFYPPGYTIPAFTFSNGIAIGNGADITNLNAASLASGLIPTGVLPSGVPTSVALATGGNVAGSASISDNALTLTVTTTNLWPATNAMSGGGIINAALPRTTCFTNASFTFGLPINVQADGYTTTIVTITNSSGSLITITPAASWHNLGGIWNCTNWSYLTLDIQAGNFTNALCSPAF